MCWRGRLARARSYDGFDGCVPGSNIDHGLRLPVGGQFHCIDMSATMRTLNWGYPVLSATSIHRTNTRLLYCHETVKPKNETLLKHL